MLLLVRKLLGLGLWLWLLSIKLTIWLVFECKIFFLAKKSEDGSERSGESDNLYSATEGKENKSLNPSNQNDRAKNPCSGTLRLRMRDSLRKRKEQILFSHGGTGGTTSPRSCYDNEDDYFSNASFVQQRARTTSEMAEVDDQVMPLPVFRHKNRRWKSTGNMDTLTNSGGGGGNHDNGNSVHNSGKSTILLPHDNFLRHLPKCKSARHWDTAELERLRRLLLRRRQQDGRHLSDPTSLLLFKAPAPPTHGSSCNVVMEQELTFKTTPKRRQTS